MTTITNIKDVVRLAMKNIRSDLAEEVIYNAKIKIIEQIKFNNDFLNADYVGIYNPINNEIDLRDLINQFPHKTFALPKIVNNNLNYVLIDDSTKYEYNEFNILEPLEGKNLTDIIKFIFVPFLAINDEGHRIGYGKGYFDRFFESKPYIIKVGVGYHFQKTTFDNDDYDIPLTYYILG